MSKRRISSPGGLLQNQSRFLRGSFLKRYKQQIRDVGTSSDEEKDDGAKKTSLENWVPPGPIRHTLQLNDMTNPELPPNVIDLSEACAKWYPPKLGKVRSGQAQNVQKDVAQEVGSANHNPDTPLMNAIVSMEARLANHGILAAPSSILGAPGGVKRTKSKRSLQEDDEYYRADDEMNDFIDDSALDDLNASDRRACPPSPRALCDPPQVTAMASEQDATQIQANFRQYIDVKRMYLETCSASSSEDSGASTESGDNAEPARADSTFQERFVQISQELKWVDWHRNREENASAIHPKIGELANALEDCCFACEIANGEQKQLVQALQKLQNRLPKLARPSPGDGWWKPPGMEKVSNDIQPAPHDAPLFDLMMAEEIAWALFVWRLVRIASKDLQKRSYLRYWIEAAKDIQKNWSNIAQSRWRAAVPKEFNRDACAQVTEYAKNPPAGERPLQIDSYLRTLSKILHNLWICYVRLRFWAEQRKTNVVSIVDADEFRALTKTDKTGFPVWAKTQLKSEFQLEVQSRFLIQLMETHKVSRATKKSMFPVKLPMSISARIGHGNSPCGIDITGNLKAVFNPDRQDVTVLCKGVEKDFRSLDEACAWVCRRCSHDDRLAKEAHGGWQFFKSPKYKQLKNLHVLVNMAAKRGLAPFANPSSVKSCETLRGLTLSVDRKVNRQTFLRNLKAKQWCSCKYVQGNAGVIGSCYNVLIYAVKNDDNGKPASVKVCWFDGTFEDNVSVQRLDEVYRYKVDDCVGYWDGRQWWKGKILNTQPNPDIASVQYTIDLNGRQVQAKFENVRREPKPVALVKKGSYSDLIAGSHVSYQPSNNGLRSRGTIVKNCGTYCVVQKSSSNVKERVRCADMQLLKPRAGSVSSGASASSIIAVLEDD